MRLLRYALGMCWTVYLYCRDDETCPILDVLTGCGSIGERMLADLHKVASRPLESLKRDTEFSKPIGNTGLFEFRLPTSKGPTPRVSYFFDSGRVIVCTLAVLKKSEKLPREFIDQSAAIRSIYFSKGGLKAAHVEIYQETSEEEP